jgi:alkanesulfonate monooxygenase SsuD/methylene tetrahydromethanopterin reductase-like flavin-dependent oxidoreductase (luciferase family)
MSDGAGASSAARAASVSFGVIPAHGPDHMAAMVDHVRLCHAYGFDSVWVEEHHAEGPNRPTPLLAVAALAPHLEGMLIGTNVLLLPFYDPLHVAEQVAVLDRLTDGRFVLGVGLGDSSVESAAFRVPTSRKGARFEEQVAIIRALWNGGPVTYAGSFYDFKEVELGPRPARAGGPPIWIGGWGPRQLSRAAAIGDAWFPGPVGTMTQVIELQQTYDLQLRQRNADPLTRARPITRDVVVGRTEAEAWDIADRTVLGSYRETYVEGEHPLVGKGSGSAFADLKQLAHDRLIIGDPPAVAAQIARCIDVLKSSHVIFRLKLPGIEPAQMTDMLHLIGRDVLPSLRGACATPAGITALAARAEP